MALGNPDHARPSSDIASLLLLVLLVAVSGCPTSGSSSDKTSNRPGDRNRGAPEEGTRVNREHPAFQEQVEQRAEMVERQVESRQVGDPHVLRAMRVVPRHAFVPVGQRPYAYADQALAIGHGQTISQPYVVAFMTEALKLGPESVLLEIGTGSGYQAAVAAEIAKEVYSIEIVEPLAESAARLLSDLGYKNVHVRAGDGYYGWPEQGPFDAIIGTAAAGHVPPPLIEQLRNGGRMILPIGDDLGFQYLILLTKDEQGGLQQEKLMPVMFVPMTGDIERAKRND